MIAYVESFRSQVEFFGGGGIYAVLYQKCFNEPKLQQIDQIYSKLNPHAVNKRTLTFFLDFIIDVVDVDRMVRPDIHGGV